MRSRLKILVAQKEAEQNRRISQKEIAEHTGLNEMTISRWMKPTPFGHIEADPLERLCKYLDCEIGDLVYFDRPRKAG